MLCLKSGSKSGERAACAPGGDGMGHAVLDAEIIKNGYLGSLTTLATAWCLTLVYFAWLGVQVDWFFVSVQIIQTLTGMTINAMLTMAEYFDRRQALVGRSETQPLLP